MATIRGAGYNRGAGYQRDPYLFNGKIESDRYALINSVGRPDAIDFAGDPNEIADAGMLDGDPFRAPGGAGRIDDVTEVIVGRR